MEWLSTLLRNIKSISIEEFNTVIGELKSIKELIKSNEEWWLKSNHDINKKILFFIYFTSSALIIIISITYSYKLSFKI